MKKFDCVVIGAGLAGAHTAYYLSRSGRSTLVLDTESIASGASGNDLGGLMPYVTHPSFVGHDLYNDGFNLTASFVRQHQSELPLARFTKAVQFASNERPKKLFSANNAENPILNTEDASTVIGSKPSEAVILYKESLIINPPSLCRFLIKESDCQLVEHDAVTNFVRTTNGIQISTLNDSYLCSNVVICNAYRCLDFPESAFFSIKKVRGQVVSFIPSGDLANVKVPLCFNGYFLPSINGSKALLGTTYDYTFLSPEPDVERNQKMLATLMKWMPSCPPQELPIEQTRVSYRTVSKDRLPIAGKIADNIFISVAHGSRGLHSAGISAQYVVAQMNGEKFKDSVAAAIDPQRLM